MTTKNLTAQREALASQIEALVDGAALLGEDPNGDGRRVAGAVFAHGAVIAQAILTAADIIAAALDRQPA